jgi:signal transduction histidine kinase
MVDCRGEVEIALFRVLQESQANVHRHSGASEASIHFHREPGALILEVRDFGRGIPEERLRLLSGLSAEVGVGLAGMRERLHQLNGKLEIESDGHGTSMRATLPLHVNALTRSVWRLHTNWRIRSGLIKMPDEPMERFSRRRARLPAWRRLPPR